MRISCMKPKKNLCFVVEITKKIIEPMFLTDSDNGFEASGTTIFCEKVLRRNSYVG